MEFTSYDGDGVLAVADELAELYAVVFAAPPWDKSAEALAHFRPRLTDDARRPGFRAVTGGSDGRVDGFATGWTTQPPFRTDRAYGIVTAELGFLQVEEHLVGAFEVDELAVRPRSQGAGLGRALLTALCEQEERAWLLTARSAIDTVAFYHRVGWHQLTPLNPDTATLAVFTKPT